MKQFLNLSIVLLFLVVNNVAPQPSHDDVDKFLAGVQECKNETGATDQDVEDLYIRVLPKTKPAKCLNACVLSKFDIVKDGKLVVDGLVKAAGWDKSGLMGKDGKTLIDSMADISRECMSIADPDKCEYAAKLRTCLNAAAKKREFCPNIF